MPQFDVAKVLYGAFALPWAQRKDCTRVLALPLALLFTLTLAWSQFAELLPGWFGWLVMPLYGAMFTLLAVPCHRLILIGLEETDNSLPGWEWRKTRFLLWTGLLWIGVGLVFMATTVASGTVIAVLLSIVFGDSDAVRNIVGVLMGSAAYLSAYYLLARFSLMLPAIATDQKIRLADAWLLGKNNGLRLMLVVCILPWALSSFLDIAWRENSSAFEVGLLTLLGCLTFIFEISALSLAYRELTRGN